MHSSMVGSLARRGMEVVSYGELKHPEGAPEKEYQLPAWGMMMLGTTFFIYFIGMSIVEYTFGRVIPTLVMVESPQEVISFEPLPTDDTDASVNKNPGLEPVKCKPITSSFRSALQLLQSKGGFRSRFRGISVFVVTQFIINFLTSTLSAFPFFPRSVANIAAIVLCAQLSLAWTMIVISEASPKPWFKRVPSMKLWKKVAVPTAALAIAEQLTIIAPFYLALAFGLHEKDPRQFADLGDRETGIMFAQGLAVAGLAAVLAFFVVIPADVTLTRVQASLLSDAEETIVPFDRSFNGKFIPEIVGGSGVVSMRDAWSTFDWSARIRLAKAYVKVFFMQFALTVVFTLGIFAQLFIIAGKDMKKLSPKNGNELDHVSLT